MIENLRVREAKSADRDAILDINTRAFGRPDEARIVEKLQADGDSLLEIVAETGGKVIGHILFYPVGVFGKLGAVGLGPMSVDPDFQRKDVGGAMIRTSLPHLKTVGAPLVFVLGHESYYPRFGFSVKETEPFESSLKGPHLMAARLRYGPPMSGRLIFPAAFGVGG